MVKPLTKQEFSLYSLLYLKFKNEEFHLDSIRWYFSKPMLKKLVFKLVEAGWLRGVGRGIYVCVSPREAVSGLFSPKVEPVLKDAGLSYCFTKASAAEIWSDESYIQRSWEYSPFFVKILKKDLKKWEAFLNSREINFFIGQPSNVVGEFVVLVPVYPMKVDFHNNKPVEPLEETIKFCESNKDSFEYVLAYIQNKYKKKTSASNELLVKAGEAL